MVIFWELIFWELTFWELTFWELIFWEVDILGVDILGVDILGVDISGVDISGVDISGVDILGVDILRLIWRKHKYNQSSQKAHDYHMTICRCTRGTETGSVLVSYTFNSGRGSGYKTSSVPATQ